MYMAKPPLSADELCKAGMSVDEQKQHLECGQTWWEGPLFPLHHVWPMGFSWSSYIAQEEMLSVCQEPAYLKLSDRSISCSFKLSKFLHAKRGVILYTTKMWCKKLHF